MQYHSPGRERELHGDRTEGHLEGKQAEGDVSSGVPHALTPSPCRERGNGLPSPSPRVSCERDDESRHRERGQTVPVLDHRGEVERREPPAAAGGAGLPPPPPPARDADRCAD